MLCVVEEALSHSNIFSNIHHHKPPKKTRNHLFLLVNNLLPNNIPNNTEAVRRKSKDEVILGKVRLHSHARHSRPEPGDVL